MSVVDVVIEKIGELDLEIGSRLPSERILAQRCDISRSSVRSALKELQSQRVLNVRQGSGYFLASGFALKQALIGQELTWSLKRVQQVCEARSFVAAHATELGSQQITATLLHDLESCLVDLGKAIVTIDARAMELFHNRFINIIHESCSNPEYIRMLNEVKIPSHHVISVMQIAESDERNAYFSEHVNLFQAVKKKNHKSAGEACSQLCHLLSLMFGKYSEAIFS